MREDFIDELIVLFSSNKIREFRQHSKPLYKYHLCGIVNSVIMQGNFWTGPGYGEAKLMSLSSNFFPNQMRKGYTLMKQRTIDTLRNNFFHSPEKDSQVDMIISFFRKFLEDYKKEGKSLILVKDFEKIIDIKKLLLKQKGIKVKDHHWLDVGFKQGIVLTVPEFFNYLDLINLWNDLIKKNDIMQNLIEEQCKEKDFLFYLNPNTIRHLENEPKLRELDYSRQASFRALIIQGVNLVESYLYYYLYNVKSEGKYKGQSKVLTMRGHIQDKQIVKDLIFKVHHHIANDTKINELYNQYLKTVDIRDRFVHTSAFVEESNKMPQLQPLLSIQFNSVINHIQTCIDFVYSIDDMLPVDDKMLFWKDRFETPIFAEEKKISVLNKFRGGA